MNTVGDKATVLSCLDPVSNSKFSVVFNIFKTEQLQIVNRVEARQNCLVLSPVLFTPPTWTRPDKTVLSCPCWRCEQAITMQLYFLKTRCAYTITQQLHNKDTSLPASCNQRVAMWMFDETCKYWTPHAYIQNGDNYDSV